jgi:hypothetical protein
MKKMIILLAVLVLTFALVIPASANGNGPAAGRKGAAGPGFGSGQPAAAGTFTFAGTITTIGANSVTVEAVGGSKLAQPSIGAQLTLAVTTQTRYVLRDGTTTTLITFADLQVGQQVSVQGMIVDSIWTASRITVGARLSCLQ